MAHDNELLSDFLRPILTTRVVWQLRTPRGNPVELRATTDASCWMGLFWTTPEHAAAAAEELHVFFQGTPTPAPVPLENFAQAWLIGMGRDGLLVGLSTDAGVCSLEMEPMALLAQLAARDSDTREFVESLMDDKRELIADAGARPAVPSLGLAASVELSKQPIAAGPRIRRNSTTSSEARALLADWYPEQVAALLNFVSEVLYVVGTPCKHTFDITRDWAAENGFEVGALLRDLRSVGVICDCEVVLSLPHLLGEDD